MQIQINTDNNIQGSAEFTANATGIITHELGRFSEKLSRIEAHINDTNSHKGGKDDIRCMLEARPEGLQPIAVTHHADNTDLAIKGAAEKMKSALSTAFDRQKDH